MPECHDEPEEVQLPEGLVSDLERAFQAIKAFNGGHGVITIQLKGLLVPAIDIQMRHFRKEQKQQKQNKVS